MKNVLTFILLSLVSYSQVAYGLGSPSPGFLCSETEGGVQDAFNQFLGDYFPLDLGQRHWAQSVPAAKVTAHGNADMNKVLTGMIDLFRKVNAAGENRLNYVVVAKSRSLQGTRIDAQGIFPRIILKTPNSELLVAFNTHPAEAGFQSIEVIRWNGKAAKYQFLNLDFSGPKAVLDGSGKSCMKCHGGEELRPNWGSYKAWGGVLPGRDDMLEAEARNFQYLPGNELTTESKAYLQFLGQIKKSKEDRSFPRLDLLDLPLDFKAQLAPGEGQEDPIGLIRKQILTKGFYRIPHHPYKKHSDKLTINIDGKTALLAGPSQMLFDQLLGQNICRIAALEKPLIERYKKYFLEHHYCEGDFSYEKLPVEIESNARRFYQADSFKSAYLKNFREIIASYPRDHRIKDDQHGDLLRDYSAHFLEGSPQEIELGIQRFLKFQQGPTHPEFNAVFDVGGLGGVDEKNAKDLAFFKTVIEPLGRSLQGWSLSQGEKGFYSFSFSDQFELLYGQPQFGGLKEVNVCKAMK